MSFYSAYNAKFTKPLVRQIVAVIQRDIQGALDQISGEAGAYLPFIQYELSVNPEIQPPMIVVAPRTNHLQVQDTQQGIEQAIQLSVEVFLSNQARNTLAEWVQDYIGAITLVLDNLGASIDGAGGSTCAFYEALPINVIGMIDPATGNAITTTTPLTQAIVTYCYVTEHAFTDLLKLNAREWFMGGALTLEVGMIEGQ